jgi:hypothetical protein
VDIHFQTVKRAATFLEREKGPIYG